MAATYAVQILTGSGPTFTTVTSIRLRTDDANTADLTNPCIIGASLTYSYWKNVSLNFSGTFTQISNIRHYTDSTSWNWGTNGGLVRGNRDTGDIGCPTGSYAQATGTPGSTGNSIATSHPYYSGQTVKTTNLLSDTSGSPALVDSSLYASPGNSKHIVIQVLVDTNASQGLQTAKTNTFLADEI